jgi:hypothetical protein
MLYAFFSVIPRHRNFTSQRFETVCLFHLHRQVGVKIYWDWECLGTYMGKGLTSTIPSLTQTRAVSPSHTHPWLPCGSLLSTACFSTQTHPHPVTLLNDWLRLFLSRTFSHVNTPTFWTPVIFRTYPPMKMEQTECSETLAYKFGRRGIARKKAQNIDGLSF